MANNANYPSFGELNFFESAYVIICFFAPALIVGWLNRSVVWAIVAFLGQQVAIVLLGALIMKVTSDKFSDKVIYVVPLITGLIVLAIGTGFFV